MATTLLPTKLAFVDVETTGLSPTQHRIIEVGIVRVEDGEVVSRYQQLIDPERPISTFITQHTGITKSMLKGMPTFADVHDKIEELLNGAFFVAHNVGFDYGFISNEYQRLGHGFIVPHFCTAQLSRRLYPQHRRHGLDYIISRFGFDCPDRHRAMDDAEVLWQFYQKVCADFPHYIVANCL